MASLIDNLINILEDENAKYEQLLELSMKKTGIIVKGDVDTLNDIISEEQALVDVISSIEKKRMAATEDISIVLNRKPEELTLPVLVELLSKQAEESTKLRRVHEKLKSTLSQMVKVNDHNQQLLQDSIDILEFEMNIAQSLKQGPATANYSGNSYADDSYMGAGSFDAKQ